MLNKAIAPTEVLQDQGGGEKVENEACTDESTARIAKRKPKSTWYEDGGRYLYRYSANGSTIFDVWKLIGEPLPRRA